MSPIPVLLDVRPRYLGWSDAPSSVLRVGLGGRTVLELIAERVRRVTSERLRVVANFDAEDGYRDAIAALDRRAIVLPTFADLVDHIESLPASDRLLLVDVRWFPASDEDFTAFVRAGAGERAGARHLMVQEASVGQTTEVVRLDGLGRLRKVQRYYDAVTWPFASGVAASVVPASALLAAPALALRDLSALRTTIVGMQVPSQDAALQGVFDLADEGGTLALNERLVRRAAEGPARPLAAGARGMHGATVSASARLLGPVVVMPGAVVEDDAVVVGPATIGAAAHVGRGAVVAQALVMPGARVRAGARVRQRVVLDGEQPEEHAEGRGASRRHSGRHPEAAVETPVAAAASSRYAEVKRVVEGALALLALALLSPLLALIALAVRFGSRGPVFYGDPREGKDGRSFRCWKFRSMRTDAAVLQRELAQVNQVDGPQFKMDKDPRVTAVGWWLRRLNLDELPQLWNIVRGEMSFVGPRPSPFRENQICVPWRQGRLSVRPGVTGLWQVCRHDRAEGDFHQWIHFDLLYVQNMSPWLDLKILVATVLTLGGKRSMPVSYLIPGARDGRERRSPERVRADLEPTSR
jgi:lipopolysaccharide/colanic/teichoic acid biosynthesis glycosyltransferase